WCSDRFPRQAAPQFFKNFARFHILPGEARSVVLLCHSFSIEFLILTGKETFDASDVISARDVRNQLPSMIDCMRNKFFWITNVACELSFLCPVCCQGRAVNYCQNHDAESCRQEECLHFFPDSKLGNNIQVFCDRSATAQDIRVSVGHFAPWFPSEDVKQPMSDEHDGGLPFVEDELPEMLPALPCNIQRSLQRVNQPEVEVANESAGRLLPFSHGHSDTSLVLPVDVLGILRSKTNNPKEVVDKLIENLQLEHTSLEQPEPETRKWIRCLARNAKYSNRRDVVEHLRQITPPGTMGRCDTGIANDDDDDQPMSDEHDGRLPFVEDELPEMLPALPCNIQRSLQRVNQPEVEVANESAGRLLPFSHGHSDTSLVLPVDVLGILRSKTNNPKEVVDKLIENLQLEHTSLEQPEPETRKWIRCLARNAKYSNRRDVVEHLRQITPPGTMGRCDTGIANDDDDD
ncbi:uncharacterized protein LOC110047753, partial [Orbicella faveolata]|uniref:uncharacterized protein LOC110047753 n=1 Tax=Orbicella faveolata TaxID=48498 RepID=UPI0009E31292